MSDKPKFRLLPGQKHILSPVWNMVADVARNQPPFQKFYRAYQRSVDGSAKPGDKFFLLRQILKQFGPDNAYVIYQLARTDENASWAWGISFFERKPPIFEPLERLVQIDKDKARRATRESRDWAIYNRVLAMIETGHTLTEAFEAIAGTKPHAAMLGTDSIEKIWKAKSRAVRETGERLVPQFGGGVMVMQPGKQPKRGRRAKPKPAKG